MTGEGAGVKREGPTSNGHPDQDTLTGGMIDVGAGVETGQGVEVEEIEIQTG